MNPLPITPSHTVGPFFAYGLTARQYGYDFTSLTNGKLTDYQLANQPVHIVGCVIDGAGNAISDAMIELWQADEAGQYRAEPIDYPNNANAFTGFGRLGTGTTADSRFAFLTVKPGSVGGLAPHINVILFMRGSLRTLYTRLYFSDETEANEQDDLLNSVAPDRRQTLIAQKTDGGYRFDIRLQGGAETVFFDL